MVILKKFKASSLMETLTASVIIIVVFMIASFSFNNIFLNTIKSNDEQLVNRISEIEYLGIHDKLDFPFYEEGAYWVILIEKKEDYYLVEVQNLRNKVNKSLRIPRDGI